MKKLQYFSLLPAVLMCAAASSITCRAIDVQKPIDFESVTPDLPMWSATSRHEGKHQYNLASKWTEPFMLLLDNEEMRSGEFSLRWEFSQNVDMAAVEAPRFPVTGSEVAIRLFVRAESMHGANGQISFDECLVDNKVSKTHWSVVKFRPEQEWTEVVWNGHLETSPSSLRIRVVFEKIPAGAKIWIDDFDVQTKN